MIYNLFVVIPQKIRPISSSATKYYIHLRGVGNKRLLWPAWRPIWLVCDVLPRPQFTMLWNFGKPLVMIIQLTWPQFYTTCDWIKDESCMMGKNRLRKLSLPKQPHISLPISHRPQCGLQGHNQICIFHDLYEVLVW